MRAVLIWAALAAALAVPAALAAGSEQLEWRDPVYIAAGFAGIAALGLALVQPLMIGGYLPGPSALRRRRAHRWLGGALVAAVVLHVAGLWVTSPPDMIDALTLRSPTPFSPFGVVAMWAAFAIVALVALRGRLRLRLWRRVHVVLAAVVVGGGAVHALLIEGTMEPVSKAALCALAVAATAAVAADPALWRRRARRGAGAEG